MQIKYIQRFSLILIFDKKQFFAAVRVSLIKKVVRRIEAVARLALHPV
jgi:hypothetical protein